MSVRTNRLQCVSFHCVSRLDESSLRSIFQEQITNLILINNDKHARICSSNYTAKIYAHILTFFENLKSLSIIEPSVVSYPPLSLCHLP
jgi:hypothetical protein